MGGEVNGTPPVYKSTNEIFFDLINCLCNRFIGLSPFEVLNRPTREVFDLYVDVVNHDRKQKQETNSQEVQWVTSKNATWH